MQTRSLRAVRQRRLASDRRSGTYARAKARRDQYAYLRAIWRELLLMAVAVVLVLGLMLLVITNDFLRGLVVGAVVVGTALSVWSFVVQVTGSAPRMMGDLGEQWSAAELRKLHRGGWQTVNHVMLTTRDIDHVVVGPGGLIAVETKWTAEAWKGVDDPRVREAAISIRQQATRLSNWANLKAVGVGRAIPVVILWGSGSRELPAMTNVDGVTVVSGPRASEWRRQLRSEGLSQEVVGAAWDVLDAQCRLRDEQSGEVIPPSPVEWMSRLFLAVLAGCVAFALVAQVVAVSHSLWVGLLALVLFTALGLVGLRRDATRLVAIGWLTGAAGILVFGLIAVAMSEGRWS